MKDELEKKVIGLFPEIETSWTAYDLYVMGYEPKHHTFRKRIGCLEVCYTEMRDSRMFEVGAIIRVRE